VFNNSKGNLIMKARFIPSVRAKDAQAALDLYSSVFNAKSGNIHYNDSMPGFVKDANFKKAILHAEVQLYGETILHLTEANEEATQYAPKTTYGDNMTISVVFEDKAELTEAYNKLKDATGTTILMPLDDAFFGTFGMLKDRFNVLWELVKVKA
jgi:uncharacterized glyoxalase superfamily protein PhnB